MFTATEITHALQAVSDDAFKVIVGSIMSESIELAGLISALLRYAKAPTNRILTFDPDRTPPALRLVRNRLLRLQLDTDRYTHLPTLTCDATFEWLCSQMCEVEILRPKSAAAVGAFRTLVEWLFWMTVFDWDKAPRGAWMDEVLDDAGRKTFERDLYTAAILMIDAYRSLTIPLPKKLERLSKKLELIVVVRSVVPPMTSREHGMIQTVNSEIAIQFSSHGPPVLVCLDSGATTSSIDEAFLLAHFPDAVIENLPMPFENFGIGNGRVLNEKFAVLDIYIPAEIDGQSQLAHVRHEFGVRPDKGVPMLIGQDFITRQGSTLNQREGKVYIAACQNAKVDWVMSKGSISQRPNSRGQESHRTQDLRGESIEKR
ncbi:hypothetical protein LTR37_000911 [Vermiconidia calcicola]|uniref:Uncharacterized protein n=1 Tax=Vermiconidia calcicola TaxID=1690605 RepID=A0ACC3NYN7_9PEZI|nr:hypothetical protein LTR37_000911 [Vermiconidia calcicola]